MVCNDLSQVCVLLATANSLLHELKKEEKPVKKLTKFAKKKRKQQLYDEKLKMIKLLPSKYPERPPTYYFIYPSLFRKLAIQAGFTFEPKEPMTQLPPDSLQLSTPFDELLSRPQPNHNQGFKNNTQQSASKTLQQDSNSDALNPDKNLSYGQSHLSKPFTSLNSFSPNKSKAGRQIISQ